MAPATRLSRHDRGVPVYRYRTDPETPPVSVVRHDELPERRPHIHDFPALWYVPAAGLVYVAAPGKVLDLEQVVPAPNGVTVFFDPGALGEDARSPWPAWQSHPLLFPFLHGQSGGVLRLDVPVARRSVWDDAIGAIETELSQRREGYRQAVLAHLTLLLIELARLARDVVADLQRSGEPLLAEVFGIIDRRHGEPLSLRDVADEVGMTPGHLTTVVRRRTGKTVQDWIIERRMTEARDLLSESDLSVGEVARRVGISDPGYFSRLFGRVHGRTPRQWRATRSQS
ncbi:AraC family transcriptional regulator [Mycobacterium asiaticum]|uniref:AraC family transcriptional regulator n=1 Tax=Mycobacterium asiaticum TaxID=1790 RepID=A0A1A3NRQ3_MYCAS|nr:AraC family transcriptional regulator [Mycobacterium asiaticum]OBK24576.1 AraC family transcriptional regulator [Mycobacterium asiaticum]